DDAGDVDGLAEETRLLEAVLAGGGVEDEQRLVRGALQAVGDDPPDLAQLVHQVRLRVQTAGGVHEDDVAMPALRGSNGVEGDGGGICALRRADEVRPCTLGPD